MMRTHQGWRFSGAPACQHDFGLEASKKQNAVVAWR
jgi:hypothetical protein